MDDGVSEMIAELEGEVMNVGQADVEGLEQPDVFWHGLYANNCNV